MTATSHALLDTELERLRERNRDLEAIFNSSFDEIFVTDGEGRCILVNSACERLYGLPTNDLIGKTVAHLERAGVFAPSATSIALKERRRVTIVQRTRTDHTVLVTATPIFEGTKITRVICNSRVVTELLELREQLVEAEDKAERYLAEIAALRAYVEPDRSDREFLQTPGLQPVLKVASRVARVDSTVLLLGESGVGKDMLASVIHRESVRRTKPLMKINCGAIPPDLVESELFGYDRGAFTGARREGRTGLIELAQGGTLFLNEIGELPVSMQVKLLQVLQDRQLTRVGGSKPITVDVRIIAATNRDLAALVKSGQFRADLYYRLNVVPIRVPSLRERHDDVEVLAQRFLRLCNARFGTACRFLPDALQSLRRHRWPGNVRELENLVERLVVTSEGPNLSVRDIQGMLCTDDDPPHAEGEDVSIRPLKQMLAEVEGRVIRAAHQRFHNTYLMAEALGISQPSAVRKVHKYVNNSVSDYDADSHH